MIAVEEGVIALDDAAGQPGCTFRHLLAHAGGYAFDGTRADQRARSTPDLLEHRHRGGGDARSSTPPACRSPPISTEAVLEPLGMDASELRGSPAHGLTSTVARPDAAARRAPASDADLRRRCGGVRHGPLSRPRGYRSRRGEVRSVPVGAGHRDPRGQDAALDRHGERAIHVRALRWCRHDGVGRPGGRMRAGGPRRPPVRRLARRGRVVAHVERRRGGRVRGRTEPHDLQSRRPGPLGGDGRGRSAGRALRVRALDGRCLRSGGRDVRRRARRPGDRRRPARGRSRSRRSSSGSKATTCSTIPTCAAASRRCGRPRPSRPGSMSTISVRAATATTTATAAGTSPRSRAATSATPSRRSTTTATSSCTPKRSRGSSRPGPPHGQLGGRASGSARRPAQLRRSTTMAMPWPPPTHIVSRPYVPPVVCRPWISVVMMRAPVMPKG